MNFERAQNTVVALHLGVFQSIIFLSAGKVVAKSIDKYVILKYITTNLPNSKQGNVDTRGSVTQEVTLTERKRVGSKLVG